MHKDDQVQYSDLCYYVGSTTTTRIGQRINSTDSIRFGLGSLSLSFPASLLHSKGLSEQGPVVVAAVVVDLAGEGAASHSWMVWRRGHPSIHT